MYVSTIGYKMGKFCPPSHTRDTWVREFRHFSEANKKSEKPTQLSPHHMDCQMSLFTAVNLKIANAKIMEIENNQFNYKYSTAAG